MKSPVRPDPKRWALAGLAGALLLTGCNREDNSEKARDSELAGQIVVDPELAGGQPTTTSGKIDLPAEQRTPQAIAEAKAEAAKLAGGAIPQAPAPGGGGEIALLEQSAANAARTAASARAAKVDCAQKVQYSADWSKALPAMLPVYPRGVVQEAAGTDSDGCRLRVVSFVTPVTTGDVMDFYYARFRAEGYEARHQLSGSDHVLGGGKDRAAYLVYARKLTNGLTEVDLVASGG